MGKYIDDGEKFVSRLGGEYSNIVGKSVRSLELTDRRIYYCTSIGGTKEHKAAGSTTSVIDAADVSAVTCTADKPKGSFTLGLFLLVIASVIGIVIGIMSYTKGEVKNIGTLILPIALGVGLGALALVACYIVTYFMAKSKRVVTIAIEYRGLILETSFVHISDSKLEEFRQWVFRVKDKLCGRPAPPLPDYVMQETAMSSAQEKKDEKADKKAAKEAAKREKAAAAAAKKQPPAQQSREQKEQPVTVQATVVQANRPSIERPNDFTGL